MRASIPLTFLRLFAYGHHQTYSPQLVHYSIQLHQNIARPFFAENMAAELSQLPFEYGTFAVLGNHEYYGDWEENIRAIRSAGIRLLRDEALPDFPNYVVSSGYGFQGAPLRLGSRAEIVALELSGQEV